MALCNDFTQPIPNTAGTGLPSNTSGQCFGGQGCWLGCPNPNGGAGDNSPHVWYSPEKDQWTSPPCNENGRGIVQVTDPTYGNLALDVDYTVTDGGGYVHRALTTMSAAVTDPVNQTNLLNDYPLASYIEIVARDNTGQNFPCPQPNPQNGCEPNVDFFTWSAAAWSGQCYQNGQYVCQVLEMDDVENWAPQNYEGMGALHNWNAGGAATGNWQGANLYDSSVYHRYGALITTNGNSDVKVCSYLDGALKGCSSYVGDSIPLPGTKYDNSGSYAQRNTLAIWSDSFNNYPVGVGALANDQHYYIKSISVWSCADWPRNSTGPNPHCFGGPSPTTGSDGSQFYNVTTP